MRTKIEEMEGRRVYWLHSAAILQQLDEMKARGCSVVGVNPYDGYNKYDVDFLLDNDWISGIYISDGSDIDLSPIAARVDLDYLVVGGAGKRPMNLDSHTRLETLRFDWARGTVLPNSKSAALRELSITGHRSKTLDFLAGYSALSSLELIRSSIESLEGVGRLESLGSLSLVYCRKLADIKLLTEANLLRELSIDNCKSIGNFDCLGEASSISKLKLSDCGKIESLSFISRMSRLAFLSFVGTNVLDGDLSPCLGLDYVGFDDKQHYLHRYSDFAKS